MKLDNYYSSITVCPDTGKQIFNYMHNNGVCEVCGHVKEGTISHRKKIVGKWLRPTLLEILKGLRKIFIPKEEL